MKRAWLIASVVLGIMVEAAGAQTPVVTIKLGKDEIGTVKTAPGITTRLSFYEPPVEIICGDLYDPNSGTGNFVVQRSGNDVFLKPIGSKGESNLFVKTGDNGERIYDFNLVVVPAAQAYRIVNVISTYFPPAAAKKNAITLPVIASITPTFSGPMAAPAGTFVDRKPEEELLPPPPLPGAWKDPDQPRLIKRKAVRRAIPEYPEMARMTGVYGQVVVEIVINEKGKVVSAHAVSGPLQLRNSAILAAKLWKFEEADEDDSVHQIGRITFNFHSPERSPDSFFTVTGAGSGADRGRRNW